MWDYTLWQKMVWERKETMKQPDLRSLSRGELLELLIQQGEEIEKLQQKVEAYEQQLQDKKLAIHEAGSIAEAALKVSGIFEAAQAASAQYLENIEQLAERQKEYTEKANVLLIETEAQCAAMRAETTRQCDKMVEKAKREALTYWTKVSRKLEGTRDK